MQGAIFDMDGTLLDSMPFWGDSADRFLMKRGVRPPPGLYEALKDLSMVQTADYLRERFGVTGTVQDVMDGINEVMEESYFHQIDRGGQEAGRDGALRGKIRRRCARVRHSGRIDRVLRRHPSGEHRAGRALQDRSRFGGSSPNRRRTRARSHNRHRGCRSTCRRRLPRRAPRGCPISPSAH